MKKRRRKEPRYWTKDAIGKVRRKVILGSFFLITAYLFILFFSTSTTPFLKGWIAGDSANYQMIGKCWTKGILPYSGVWDHKGPVMFFINAVGYLLSDSKAGVFYIQVATLTVTEMILYRFFRQEFSLLQSVLLTLVGLLALMFNYSEGNGTEEYLLPFLCGSFCGIWKWIKSYIGGEAEHNPGYAFCYGFTFAFCLLTRLTNAIGLCLAVFFICICLLVQKKWRNLIINGVAFLFGFAVLTVPVFTYFLCKGQLGEMWYATITYNLKYMQYSGIAGRGYSLKGLLEILLGYSASVILVFVGLLDLLMSRAGKKIGLLWIMVGGGTAVWLFQSNGYLHYGIVALPYVALIFNELKRLLEESLSGIRNLFAHFCIWGMISIYIAGGYVRIVNLRDIYAYYEKTLKPIELLNAIPKEEKDSFIAYNCASTVYLNADLYPCYPYFILQDWQSSYSGEFAERIRKTFAMGDARWILVNAGSSAGIEDILKERYECVGEEKTGDHSSNGGYRLYRLKY